MKNIIQSKEEIYKEAIRASKIVIKHFEKLDRPFKRGISIFTEHEILEIKIVEIPKFKESVIIKINNIISEMDISYMIPILLQSIGNSYYQKKIKNISVGQGYKKSLSLVWEIFANKNDGSSKSLNELIKLVEYALFYNQLEAVELLANINHFSSISISTDSLIIDQNIKDVIIKHNLMSENSAKHRSLNIAIEFIWRNPFSFLTAMESKLFNNLSPEYFKNTIFERIDIKHEEFWFSLYLRVRMFLNLASNKMDLISENIYSEHLYLFENSTMFVPTTKDANSMKKALNIFQQNFWQLNWYKKRFKQEYNINMIVEKPFIRIRHGNVLYITGYYLLMDSINAFIESALFRNEINFGIKLDPSIFNDYISRPFEQEVADILKSYNFQVGTVNDKSIWLIDDKNQKLTNKNQSFPGEIDILAYSEHFNILLIFECKVLNRANTINGLRNTLDKLGQYDKEGFHSKLRKKVSWIKTTEKFLQKKPEIFYSLITDIYFPVDFNKEFPVIWVDHLKEFLNENVKSRGIKY